MYKRHAERNERNQASLIITRKLPEKGMMIQDYCIFSVRDSYLSVNKTVPHYHGVVLAITN